jgi:hypothetical protein
LIWPALPVTRASTPNRKVDRHAGRGHLLGRAGHAAALGDGERDDGAVAAVIGCPGPPLEAADGRD